MLLLATFVDQGGSAFEFILQSLIAHFIGRLVPSPFTLLR